MTHDNSPLSAGTVVRALDFPSAQFRFDQTLVLNITATAYTTGSPEVAVRFMAPTSGRVAVNLGAGVRSNSVTPDRVFVAFRILEEDPNDGDVTWAEEVKYGRSNHALANSADDFEYGGHLTIVDGLTPGTFYYAQVRHRTVSGSGTADISYRSILVFPIP